MRILGYEWEDIQARQMRTYKAPTVDVTSPLPMADNEDRAMLAQYGSIEALREAGMHGVVGRLMRPPVSGPESGEQSK